jgi:D-alanyl-D-alanine carboxypeptidase
MSLKNKYLMLIISRRKIMQVEQVKVKIENKLKEIVASNRDMYNIYLLIHSDKYDIHWNIAEGDVEGRDQPYHTASIGKVFTATIIAQLVEEGKLKYTDSIAKYLTKDILKDLHVYKGKHYSSDIRIEHLLNHSSGLPDFYEDKPKEGKRFLDILLDEPSRFWTPEETIEWSKRYMNPRFVPGKKVYYTDTSYNLLGLIIENVTSKPYHEVLHERVFQPLKMNHSYLSQFSQPAERSNYSVATIHLNKQRIDVENQRGFSSFYAGGQTVSTSEDLLKFMKALVGNTVIPKDALQQMMQWKKMWIGVDYGYGLMRIRPLPFTEKYTSWGHLGSIGSFMLYAPKMDVYIIGNFNHTNFTKKSVRFVFDTLRFLDKVKTD